MSTNKLDVNRLMNRAIKSNCICYDNTLPQKITFKLLDVMNAYLISHSTEKGQVNRILVSVGANMDEENRKNMKIRDVEIIYNEELDKLYKDAGCTYPCSCYNIVLGLGSNGGIILGAC